MHAPEVKTERIRGRANARQRGYTRAWEKARAVYLRAHPLCADCQKHGQLTPAHVVDHKVPHRGDQDLFWNEDNWQSLCSNCHSSHKQAAECGHVRGVGVDGWTL
jgi:5-methylcytosine-specific restriction enzyme A